jgi:cytosine/uracil/thiamine/allantoin permease
MTLQDGFTLFFLGWILIFAIAFIVYWVINKQERDKQAEKDQEEFKKRIS